MRRIAVVASCWRNMSGGEVLIVVVRLSAKVEVDLTEGGEWANKYCFDK